MSRDKFFIAVETEALEVALVHLCQRQPFKRLDPADAGGVLYPTDAAEPELAVGAVRVAAGAAPVSRACRTPWARRCWRSWRRRHNSQVLIRASEVHGLVERRWFGELHLGLQRVEEAIGEDITFLLIR